MMTGTVDAVNADVVQRLEREKELVGRLTELLQEELDLITNQNVDALEESLPAKQQILMDIADNRQGLGMIGKNPPPQFEVQVRGLQEDLVRLWKKASGLNELSKTMVNDRLDEIERQLTPFFTGTKENYDHRGRKAKARPRILNTGV